MASSHRNWSTSALVGAGEVLQTLKPAAFASALLAGNDQYRNQKEIAAAVGCNQSTVSAHLSALSNLPVPVVAKEGHSYVVTESGRIIIDLVDSMAARLGISVTSIEWTNDDQRAGIERVLTPLHNSRSVLPFFTLWSLGIESGAIDPLQTTDSIALDELIAAVEPLQRDRDQRVEKMQLRQTITDRFIPADVVETVDDEYLLTKKGREQARLIDKLSEYVSEYKAQDSSSMTSKTLERTDTSSISEDQTPDSLGQQATPKGFRGVDYQQITPNSVDASNELTALLPTLCIASDDPSSETSTTPTPVLPLSSMTVGKLLNETSELAHRYGEEAHLSLLWTIQTEEGLVPVSPLVGTGDDQE